MAYWPDIGRAVCLGYFKVNIIIIIIIMISKKHRHKPVCTTEKCQSTKYNVCRTRQH